MKSTETKTTINKDLNVIEKFRTSNNFWVQTARDLVFVAGVILVIMAISQFTLGVFGVPAVSVISGSMEPNLNIGDLVIYGNLAKTGVITYEEGEISGYKSFNKYGDVIIYGRYGNKKDRLIHRALYWVDEGEEMYPGGPIAPHSGYITKGDHNSLIDQKAPNISYGQPVKIEWIVGVSKWRIPWLGYPSMKLHEYI
jgi:signal peptidase